ncbi:hypothetical protein P3X46_018401 [Hevea brasiliensis]|uniref:CNNM transmembrane domain-containing protein n=1 Tax=Hevea brasiliensis TaxID=3981 RepID=A0ABQ9LQM2_HEVBR|nr:hypothetical protein P3X46_018401 [Hevea brasiliensis]
MAVEYKCCETDFFIQILIILLMVIFAGSIIVDLEVLAQSGTPKDRKHAAKILPVVKNQHLLLCTLLICNAAAMEALPIFLDSLVTAWGAILISVTLILLFGEIIPQSVCSRYGLAIGATVAPIVRVLVWICFPVAYPISKHCFKRAELKTLVNFHGNEAGKGGELTHDETTIIAGALELSEKTAGDAMTPISETFKGHSRVPVYYEQPTNIIGLILVKNLLTIHPEDETPVKNVTIRRIPRVQENLPLYDILNEFQKGHSHMAVVVRKCNKTEKSTSNTAGELMLMVKSLSRENFKNRRPPEVEELSQCRSNSFKGSRSKKWTKDLDSDILLINGNPLPQIPEEEEAVGIITMEDVIEELLQEEIYDETDHHFEDT